MAEYVSNGIRYFEPDNDENTFYINVSGFGYDLDLLVFQATQYFKCEAEDLTITAEWIQTACLGHDQYDPGDYSMYLVITRKK